MRVECRLYPLFLLKKYKKYYANILTIYTIRSIIYIGGEGMKDKIKELIEVVGQLEELTIKLISLAGWIAILILAIKGIFS